MFKRTLQQEKQFKEGAYINIKDRDITQKTIKVVKVTIAAAYLKV